MDIKVIDKGGDWLHHSGEFRLFHHQRSLMLEPGTTYRIESDAWIKEQVVLKEAEDPMGGEKPKAKADKPAADKAPAA